MLWIFAWFSFRDTGNRHRLGSACFWLLLGGVLAFGSMMPHWLVGLLVLSMVAIDGAGLVGGRQALSAPVPNRIGDRIFWPVLVIPVVTFGTAVVFRFAKLDPNRGALVGLGFGAVLAMLVGLILTRSSFEVMMREGHRLNEAMGAVNILPQLLASLGVVFTAAKVGDLIALGISYAVPENSLFLLVLANCLGMTLFTIVMGNSFRGFSRDRLGSTGAAARQTLRCESGDGRDHHPDRGVERYAGDHHGGQLQRGSGGAA